MKQPSDACLSPRGFIVMVVVGFLALLLVLCVGFLSYTRGELNSVTALRDRADCNNALWSAVDWTAANIIKDVFSGNQFDPTKIVAHVRDKNNPSYQWWYKPVGMDPAYREVGSRLDSTHWVYLPRTFLPDGGLRVRIAVQVWDPNGVININDWMEDGNPTQCQMAHMLMDATADNYLERERAASLTRYSNQAPDNGGSILPHAKYPSPPYKCSGTAPLNPCPYHLYPHKPYRYSDAWRKATHTIAYEFYSNGFTSSWITTNEAYFWANPGNSPVSMIEGCIATNEGSISDNFNKPQTYTCAYVDPDTGRSPINVNAGIPQGRIDWHDGYDWSSLDNAIRGVFNIGALRRIVRIGKFYYESPPGSGTKIEGDARDLYKNPASFGASLDDARKKVEEYRTRIAYEYQEVLCRYFAMRYPQRDFHTARISGAIPWAGYATYFDRYKVNLGAIEAGKVKYYCTVYDYSKPRFPYGLREFREHVRDDLLVMAANTRNTDYKGTDKDDDGFVGVDDNDNFEIAPGKLDRRIASAIYDNIVPGPAILYPNETDDEVKRPLWNLYQMRLARDENGDAQYNFPAMEGAGAIPVGPSTPSNQGFPKTISAEKGRDIALSGAPGVGATGSELGPWEARAVVPERQLIFGPDSFSTELTTATTTFVMIVGAQVVDVSTGLATPQVQFSRYVGFVVELAPDILDETSENAASGASWPLTGLGYYRGGWPKKRITNSTVMDQNCATVLVTGQNGVPHTDTSAALQWFDFRNVKPGDEGKFYTGASQQNRKHLIIRRVIDFNQRNY